MCRACLYGHRTECEYDDGDCCCLCNESIHSDKSVHRVHVPAVEIRRRADQAERVWTGVKSEEQLWTEAIVKARHIPSRCNDVGQPTDLRLDRAAAARAGLQL